MNDRKYVAISIKHSIHRPNLQYWGYKRTADNEKRCFALYVEDIDTAELYSYEEFNEKYSWMGEQGVQVVENESLFNVLTKKFRREDTVLVDYKQFKQWLEENEYE